MSTQTQPVTPFAFAPIEESPLYMDAFNCYDNASVAMTKSRGVSDLEEHAVETAYSASLDLMKAVINVHIAEQIAAAYKHQRIQSLPDPPRFAAMLAQLRSNLTQQEELFNSDETGTLRPALYAMAELLERMAREIFSDAIQQEKEGASEAFVNSIYDDANKEWQEETSAMIAAMEAQITRVEVENAPVTETPTLEVVSAS